jgi:hypothetical protein
LRQGWARARRGARSHDQCQYRDGKDFEHELGSR